MKPVSFPESNAVLGPPLSMTREECGDLPIHRSADGRIISCWEIEPEEVEEIKRTGRIWLHVYSGVTQPPVAVDAFSPWSRSEEKSEEGDAQ